MRRMPTDKDFEELESRCVKMIHTTNIQAMTDEQLNQLRAGDVVVKHTGEMEHAYSVTYKQEKHGICISYYAAGYLETVSYDYVEGHWQYNSTDVTVING